MMSASALESFQALKPAVFVGDRCGGREDDGGTVDEGGGA